MKRDLLIAGVLVVLAGLGIGVVVMLPALQVDDEPKVVKPKPEPIAAMPKKEEPPAPPPPPPVKKSPIQVADNNKKLKSMPKTVTPDLIPVEEKPAPKSAPEPKKIEPEPKKVEPKIEVKLEPKVGPKQEEKRPIAKVIAFDPLYQLNDPDGEYTVKTLGKGKEIELVGKIKTLKIAGVNEHSVIDAIKLVAEEVIFLGNVNGGSKVVLGKTQKLRIRDVNNRAEIDASKCEAREIVLEGAVNSASTVKLGAAKGSIEILGEINDRAQIEILAPDSKVVFKSRGDAVINGDAKLMILARDVEFAGAINGAGTELDITLTRDGSLKFRRLNGGVRLHYRKAEPGDPDPRLERGEVDARADFRPLPPGKR